MNYQKARYAIKTLPWFSLIAGFFLYIWDLRVQGLIPHINSTMHESGHFIFGAIAGVPVTSVNIGSSGGLIIPVFKVGQTIFNVHWSTLRSYVDPGMAVPPVFFFFGGPVISVLWGGLLAYLARATAAKLGRVYTVLTIVLALAALDSFVGRGVFNFLPLYPNSDGSMILRSFK